MNTGESFSEWYLLFIISSYFIFSVSLHLLLPITQQAAKAHYGIFLNYCLLNTAAIGSLFFIDDAGLRTAMNLFQLSICAGYVGFYLFRCTVLYKYESHFDRLHHVFFALAFSCFYMADFVPLLILILSLSQLSGIAYHYNRYQEGLGKTPSVLQENIQDMIYFVTRIVLVLIFLGTYYYNHYEMITTEFSFVVAAMSASCAITLGINFYLLALLQGSIMKRASYFLQKQYKFVYRQTQRGVLRLFQPFINIFQDLDQDKGK